MQTRRKARRLAAAAATTAVVIAGGTASVNADMTAAETEALKAQIKQEVLDELLEKGELDAAIEAGIERFVDKQRRARAEAEAREQENLAALAKNVRAVSAERDHIYGNPEAEVSLIEYSDFECPFCKMFHSTAKELVDKYDGKVNWVYRHFPLAFHNPGAQKQAEASECAAELGGNDAFWAYSDAIYERTTSNGNGFPLDQLVPLAVEIGLNRNDFEQCVAEARYASRVKEDYEEGVRAGVRGTPGNILLNNETGEAIPRSGAAPVDILEQMVDRLLEGAS